MIGLFGRTRDLSGIKSSKTQRNIYKMVALRKAEEDVYNQTFADSYFEQKSEIEKELIFGWNGLNQVI